MSGVAFTLRIHSRTVSKDRHQIPLAIIDHFADMGTKVRRYTFAAVLAVFLASCSTESTAVGKWLSVQKYGTGYASSAMLELFKDGSCSIEFNPANHDASLAGRFQLANGHNITLEMSAVGSFGSLSPPGSRPIIRKGSVIGSLLTLISSDGSK
jgi:hypothetical protein